MASAAPAGAPAEPFLAPAEGYERLMHLQSGAFGTAWLERDVATGEEVAIKYLPRGAAVRARAASGGGAEGGGRGRAAAAERQPSPTPARPRRPQVTVNVQREAMSHRVLHRACAAGAAQPPCLSSNFPPDPNVIQFRKALCTATHLAIVMEYAAGGELFTRIASAPAQRFGEAQARFFFMQLLAGVGYVHSQSMAHRDLKLEARRASRTPLGSCPRPGARRPRTVPPHHAAPAERAADGHRAAAKAGHLRLRLCVAPHAFGRRRPSSVA